VNLSEIMEEQDLGPNGAQVAAADMIAMNARELAESSRRSRQATS